MNIEMVHAAKTVKDLGLKTRAAVAKPVVNRRTLARDVVTSAEKPSVNADAPTVITSPQRLRKQKRSSNSSTKFCMLRSQIKHEMLVHQWKQLMPQFLKLMTLRKNQSWSCKKELRLHLR